MIYWILGKISILFLDYYLFSLHVDYLILFQVFYDFKSHDFGISCISFSVSPPPESSPGLPTSTISEQKVGLINYQINPVLFPP